MFILRLFIIFIILVVFVPKSSKFTFAQESDINFPSVWELIKYKEEGKTIYITNTGEEGSIVDFIDRSAQKLFLDKEYLVGYVAVYENTAIAMIYTYNNQDKQEMGYYITFYREGTGWQKDIISEKRLMSPEEYNEKGGKLGLKYLILLDLVEYF